MGGGNTCGQVGDGSFTDCTKPKMAMGKATIEVITAEERLAQIMVGPSEVDAATLAAQGGGFKWEHGEEGTDNGAGVGAASPTADTAKVPDLLLRITGGSTVTK